MLKSDQSTSIELKTITCLSTNCLFVSGSHNAMAYSLDVDSSVLEPKKLKSLDQMFSSVLRPIVKKWGTVQVNKLLKYSCLEVCCMLVYAYV